MGVTAALPFLGAALPAMTVAGCAQPHGEAPSARPSARAPVKKGGEDVSGPYEVHENWPSPLGDPGYTWGSVGGVFAESADRIYVLMRGQLRLPSKAPADYTGAYGAFDVPAGAFGIPATNVTPRLTKCLFVVDGQGKIIETWTQLDHYFKGGRGPHKIKINPYDPERHIWVVDDQRQQIFKFTHDGRRLVMSLGEAGVPGTDNAHFNGPTELAWLPDGTFFVTDGYVNSRVVKFDPAGKFIKTWGTKGTGPGQFNLPHSIDIDRQRRLYVADRDNSRVQIFDEEGRYLDEWPDIRSPFHLVVSPDQHVWVSDGVTNKFLQYSPEGHLLSSWGTCGSAPGSFWGVHQFSVDPAGNLYVAEAFGGRAQKFVARKGVDASLLIPAMQNARTS
jgi:DNA-binding beta-propeller fold protein YncE